MTIPIRRGIVGRRRQYPHLPFPFLVPPTEQWIDSLSFPYIPTVATILSAFTWHNPWYTSWPFFQIPWVSAQVVGQYLPEADDRVGAIARGNRRSVNNVRH